MRKLIVVAVLVGLLGGAVFLSVRPYRAWRHSQQMQMARSFAAAGDYRSALIALQQALVTDARDVEACRMMAELSEMSGAPVALSWRQRVVELQSNSVPDLLALGRSLVAVGKSDLATKVFLAIPTNAASELAYQRLGSALAFANGDLIAAEHFTAEIARREPTNLAAQVSLLSLRLMKTDAREAAEARAGLEKLSGIPSVRRDALRQLASDAVRSRETNRALKLAESLCAGTNVARGDQMIRLEALQLARSPELIPALEDVQREAAASTGEAYALANWMVRNGSPRRALEWLAQLPPGVRTNQPLPIAMADAYAATSNWVGLLEFTQDSNWREVEFLRCVQRARAYRGQGSEASARAEWTRGLQAAVGKLESLGSLFRNSLAWGWKEEAREVLWELVKRYPSERWARRELQSRLVTEGQTRPLMGVLSAAVDADPSDLDAKNDLALVALLLNAKDKRPFDLAAELHRAKPENPFYASTFAFSLFLQGKLKEAKQVFESLPKQAVELPGVGVYYGLVLNALGERAAAAQFLKMSESAELLPEERRLFTEAQSAP